MKKKLVLINNGSQNLIGHPLSEDNPECILQDAFMVIEMAMPTEQGPARMQGIVPIIPNHDKPIEILTIVNSSLEITEDMELHRTYQQIHAKCSGIHLPTDADMSALKL